MRLSATLLSGALATLAAAQGINVDFNPAQELTFDTDGNVIGMYNDHINFLNNTYVWYGNTYQCQSASLLTGFCGIRVYTSNDFANWENLGFLFDPNTTDIQALCDPVFSGNCGRPHILYNSNSSQYVLYVNAGTPGFAVFTSSEATSGYTFAGRSVLPSQSPATTVGDFSIEIINGTGYAAFSIIDFRTTGASVWPPFSQSVYVTELTSDFLNTTGTPQHVIASPSDLVDNENESPEIFMNGDYFYVLTSNTCGFCNGTLLNAYRATNISGPWTRQILSGDTGGSQLAGVLSLTSPSSNQTQYLLYADLTTSTPNELFGVRTSVAGKLFRQLNFDSDGSIQDADFSPTASSFTLNIAPGTGSSASGNATNSTFGTPNNASYQWSCDIGMANIYQTFTVPANGTLNQFGFVVASNGQNGPLEVELFRFSNYTALVSPYYVWETLSTQSFPASSLGVGPGTLGNGNSLLVPGNGTQVAQGDLIGAAIVNGGSVPYCYLYTNSSSLNSAQLLKNGENQVSPRGPQGQASPVFVYPGSMKFFVDIN